MVYAPDAVQSRISSTGAGYATRYNPRKRTICWKRMPGRTSTKLLAVRCSTHVPIDVLETEGTEVVGYLPRSAMPQSVGVAFSRRLVFLRNLVGRPDTGWPRTPELGCMQEKRVVVVGSTRGGWYAMSSNVVVYRGGAPTTARETEARLGA